MLGLAQRPFGPDIHTINLTLLNQPGNLALVLIVLLDHGVNIEHVSLGSTDMGTTSTGTLAVCLPAEQLDSLQRRLNNVAGVIEAHAIGSRVTDDEPLFDRGPSRKTSHLSTISAANIR